MSATKASSKIASQITFESLRAWNIWLAALQAIQGVVILIISATRSLPITTNYSGVDTIQTQVNGRPVLAAATHHLFDVNLAYLIAVLFFVTATAHVLAATQLRANYEKDLKKGINMVRWLERAFNTGAVLVMVALLSGVYDISSLIMIFMLGLIMNLFGLVIELHNQGATKAKKMSWLGYVIAGVAGVIPWMVILMYLIGAHVYGGTVPTFVYWIYAILFALSVGYGANVFLQHRKVGKWANYLYGERVFMVLSLAVNTVLAWQVFAGSLRP